MKTNATDRIDSFCLDMSASLSDAAGLFLDHDLSEISLTDGEGCFTGRFTRQDLFKAVHGGRSPQTQLAACLTEKFPNAPDPKASDNTQQFPESVSRGRLIRMFEHFTPAMADQINAFLDFVHNPVVGIDAGGIVVIWNRAAGIVFKHPRSQTLGLPIKRFISESQLHRIVQTGQQELVQKLHFNGKVYMSNRTPVKSDGRVIGAVAVLQDVSQLEAISNELKQTKMISDKLDAVIESSFDGIIVADGEGRINIANKAYERITGVKRREILGKKMDVLVNEGFYNESVTLLVLEKREPTTIVQKVKTGKTIIVTGTPIFDDKGEIPMVVTNVRDVTELNRLQEALEKMEVLQIQYKSRLEKLRETVETSNGIIIASKKMEEIYDMMMHMARVDSTILLQGESGVGKEIFAELIHSNSKRRNKPFVKINCAAIPEHLLESELFGYVSGSFTGAKNEGKAGLFEAADKGSIFLDEIGDMPLGLQTKILRVLQEKEVLRIGDIMPRKIDVRIIAATNRDLNLLIQNRSFRKDLFFRLNVVPIVIPPLRERKEAITIFVYHFLKKYNLKYGFSKQLDPKVLNSLVGYDWPGNVRELENVVERLVVTTIGEVITRQTLPDNFKGFKGVVENVMTSNKPLYALLAEAEYQVLSQAIKQHKTTRKVSDVLGISQSTVVRKLKRHGIETQWGTQSSFS